MDQAREFASAFRRNLGAFRRYEYSFFQGMRRLLGAFYGSIRGENEAPQNPLVVVRTARAIDRIIEGVDRSMAQAEKGSRA